MKEIDYKTAINFLLPLHYSGRKPSISYAFGYYENDILKAFGNVKYSPNYNTYLANKAANSNNDLYFTDLQTTGVVKIPIASSATTITGTINYRIGRLVKTYTFSV